MNKTDKTKENQSKSIHEERPWLFKPGQSGNPKGKPRGLGRTPVNELLDIIAKHKIKLSPTRKRKLGLTVDEITTLEHILLDWATSLTPAKQQMFIERYLGKMPNVNQNVNSNFDFMKHADKFTDSELEEIKNGADPLDILFSKLPSVEEYNAE